MCESEIVNSCCYFLSFIHWCKLISFLFKAMSVFQLKLVIDSKFLNCFPLVFFYSAIILYIAKYPSIFKKNCVVACTKHLSHLDHCHSSTMFIVIILNNCSWRSKFLISLIFNHYSLHNYWFKIGVSTLNLVICRHTSRKLFSSSYGDRTLSFRSRCSVYISTTPHCLRRRRQFLIASIDTASP